MEQEGSGSKDNYSICMTVKGSVPARQQNGEGYGLNVESAKEDRLASCLEHPIALLNFIDDISNMPLLHTTPLNRGPRILKYEATEFAINRTSRRTVLTSRRWRPWWRTAEARSWLWCRDKKSSSRAF